MKEGNIKNVIEKILKEDDFRLLEMLYLCSAKSTYQTSIMNKFYKEKDMWSDVFENMELRYPSLTKEEFNKIKEKLISICNEENIDLLKLHNDDEKELSKYLKDIFKEKIIERVKSLDKKYKKILYTYSLLEEIEKLTFQEIDFEYYLKIISILYKTIFNESLSLEQKELIELLIKVGLLVKTTTIHWKYGSYEGVKYRKIYFAEDINNEIKFLIEKEIKEQLPNIENFFEKYSDNIIEVAGVEYLLLNGGKCKREEIRNFLWCLSLKAWNQFESYQGIISSKEEDIILLNPRFIEDLKRWVKLQKEKLKNKKLDKVKELLRRIENIDFNLRYEEKYGIYKGFITLTDKTEVKLIIAPYYHPSYSDFFGVHNMVILTEYANKEEIDKQIKLPTWLPISKYGIDVIFNVLFIFLKEGEEISYWNFWGIDEFSKSLSERLLSYFQTPKEKERSSKFSNKVEKEIEIKDNAFFLGRNHWKIFQKFLSMAENEIKICTECLSSDALFTILKGVKNGVKIKIINRRGRGYEEIKKRFTPEENWKRYKYIHAKFCIIDNKAVLIGSSNITESSLGKENEERPSSIEAEIVSMDENIVKDANNLFDIIWNEKEDIEILKTNSNFISSAYGIPTKILQFFEKAKEEIIIIVPAIFEDGGDILKYLREINKSQAKIKVITHREIPKKYVEDIEKLKKEEIEFIFVSDRIHSKIYVFDWKVAIISSVNLSLTSWYSSLECGYITEKNEILQEIKEKVNEWKSRNTEFISKDEEIEDVEREEVGIPLHELPFETEGKRIKFIEMIKGSKKEFVENKKPILLTSKPQKLYKKSEKEVKDTPPLVEKFKISLEFLKSKRAWVRKVNKKGWRIGKGFSREEVKQAGLSKKYATDSRRKTCHPINVKILKEMIKNLQKYKIDSK